MTRAGPGRPRLTSPRRPGTTARAEILDAAAELFSTRGFATTSTRQIADAVGIRQASLYNHFATKSDILATLLDATIAPTVEFDESLDDSEPAAVLLCALTWFDAAQLCAGRWNLGALYMLPEVRSEPFESFRQGRLRLARRYRDLAVEVLGGSDPRAELPFRLVESVIDIRADRQMDEQVIDAQLPEILATAALTVLGRPTEDVVDRARALVVGVADDSLGAVRAQE
ncbi:TetR/AcrR family transcriptional regulator [Rhodococcus artemisiae]|uniref:Helix-turn-helix domain-containing protein n=1 Tax=Rhodococcus artemisiae TaxID=714159 RepID=A0ABU7LIU5_9NOCA|nr:helix-turn-helix domain-containing protein [Rhodococcus artemisiae]MEE2061435.1 helix-turn-helix domain-containing protein [Rhodococcus artemisiae]